ncbi:3183_t:CDS:2, partial [Racocetra persica]
INNKHNANGMKDYWIGVLNEYEKENLDKSTMTENNKRKKQKRGSKTELEFLSKIPPPIYYPNLDKGTTTTISPISRTPSSVKLWSSFLNSVKSHQFDSNAKQYASPRFKDYNQIYNISNEEDVRGALKNNILDNLHILTTSRNPVEVFKRIAKEDNIIGEPDFIYKQANKLLLIVEVKTLWVLYLDNEEQLHTKFNEVLEKRKNNSRYPNSGSNISVVEILRQIFGYLVTNRLQYRILTTYNQHWFLKRPKNESDTLYVSPTIKIADSSDDDASGSDYETTLRAPKRTNIDEFIGIGKEFEQCLKSINSGTLKSKEKHSNIISSATSRINIRNTEIKCGTGRV